ncbi:MAG TPA: riboflavin synthase [Polyangiaceae bacterium]|nr:riboflavin synthase [Polyangiaceae bacterium]
MFTGIITGVGRVRAIEDRGDRRFFIEVPFDASAPELGASVACSGVCLTVVGREGGALAFDVSAETLSKTTLGRWREGTRVNLERSLKLGDELGGHLVYGHVDGLARLIERRPEGASTRFVFEAPEALAGLVAPKGSVALDGISLTVNEVEGRRFGVNIIPHTLAVTTLAERGPGDELHFEADMLARYVARQLAWRQGGPG